MWAGSGLDSWPPKVNSWLSDLLANSRVMTPHSEGPGPVPALNDKAGTGPSIGRRESDSAARARLPSGVTSHAEAAAHLSPSPGVTESQVTASAAAGRRGRSASRLAALSVGRGSGLDSWPPKVNSWLSYLLVNSRVMTPVAAGRRPPRVPGLYRL